MASDPLRDLAVLHVPGLQLAPLRTAPLPESSDPVFQIGYPKRSGLADAVVESGDGGNVKTIASRRPVAVNTIDDDGRRWDDLVVRSPGKGDPHGFSGGPVVDAEGRVVATNTMGGVDTSVGRFGPHQQKNSAAAAAMDMVDEVRPKIELWRRQMPGAVAGAEAARSAAEAAALVGSRSNVAGVVGASACLIARFSAFIIGVQPGGPLNPSPE